MLSKIFWALLAISILTAGALTFYSYGWLESIGDPKIAAENFQYLSGIGWTFIWISSVVLLVLANFLVWRGEKSWFLWSVYIYFAFFIILHTFWLAQAFQSFKELKGLSEDTFSITPFLGVIICLVVAIGVFFNQYILKRLRGKLSGENESLLVEKSASESEPIK